MQHSFEDEGIRYSEKSDRGQSILKEQLKSFGMDVLICFVMIIGGLASIATIAYFNIK